MEKMLQAMMKRFPMFIAMGAMIVVISLIIGAINASNAADYYAVDKATRDASVEWAQVRSSVESTVVWLPYFKFLGVVMILSGIVMALGVIGMRLQRLGREVMASVPDSARLPIPPKPRSVYVMRMFMMLGMMIIIIGFIVSLITASTAADVYDHTVKEIDSAQAGSALLADLGGVHATEAWLEAFKFVAIGFLFLSIVYGLHTIVLALRYQGQALPQVAQRVGSARSDAPTTGVVPSPAPAAGD